MSDFILYIIVVVHPGGRFSSFYGCMRISCILRNLKDAATRPNVPFGTGGLKSLNLDISNLFI